MESELQKTLAVTQRRNRERYEQIKSRDRVRDLAEVYTHEREVNAMLDLMPDMFPATASCNTTRQFLEPACGHGNFLDEILRRKLKHVSRSDMGAASAYEHRILRGSPRSTGWTSARQRAESRERMLSEVRAHLEDALTPSPRRAVSSWPSSILDTNVICADLLADAAENELIDYRPVSRDIYTRVVRMLDPAPTSPTYSRCRPRRRSAGPLLELARTLIHGRRLRPNREPPDAKPASAARTRHPRLPGATLER